MGLRALKLAEVEKETGTASWGGGVTLTGWAKKLGQGVRVHTEIRHGALGSEIGMGNMGEGATGGQDRERERSDEEPEGR